MTDVKRLFDFPYYQLEHYPQERALVSKVDGKWKTLPGGAVLGNDQFEQFDALFEAYWLNGGREKRQLQHSDLKSSSNPSVRSAQPDHDDEQARGNEAGEAEEADQDDGTDAAHSGES